MTKKTHKNQQDLLLLHEQKFHPEMTKKYFFKEGKYSMRNPNEVSKEDEKQEAQDANETDLQVPKESGLSPGNQEANSTNEIIGPKSFVPIMLLGKGSFGEVYLVQKKSNKMFYAMKVLQKDKLMGQNLVKYARTERNVLSYTKHPFIVGLNYAFQTREKLFLILDY